MIAGCCCLSLCVSVCFYPFSSFIVIFCCACVTCVHRTLRILFYVLLLCITLCKAIAHRTRQYETSFQVHFVYYAALIYIIPYVIIIFFVVVVVMLFVTAIPIKIPLIFVGFYQHHISFGWFSIFRFGLVLNL